MSLDIGSLSSSLRRIGQEHILRFWGELSPAGREKLTTQLAALHLDEIADLVETYVKAKPPIELPGKIEPPNVLPRTADAGREALYLLRRAGCERLGLITSNARTASLVEREKVFVAAARAAGMDVTVTEAGPTSYESGQEAARRVFGRSSPPDGGARSRTASSASGWCHG